MKTEKILVFPNNEHFKSIIDKQGCYLLEPGDLEKVFEDGVYGTRYLMEENERFKQAIGYVAIIKDKQVLSYQRTSKGNESKLHAKWSIGIGGHVDQEDDEQRSVHEVFIDSIIREVKEEIGLDINTDDIKPLCYINDDSGADNGVGRVHLGIGCVIYVDELDLDAGEIDVLEKRKFIGPDETEVLLENMEQWSQLFYKAVVHDLIS